MGWLLIFFFTLVSFMGLTGSGPLSSAEARSSDIISIQYDRFARISSSASLKIAVKYLERNTNEFVFLLNNDFAHSIQINSIIPEPDTVEAAEGELRYAFKINPTAITVPITINYQPLKSGILPINFQILNGDQVSFKQFVYP